MSMRWVLLNRLFLGRIQNTFQGSLLPRHVPCSNEVCLQNVSNKLLSSWLFNRISKRAYFNSNLLVMLCVFVILGTTAVVFAANEPLQHISTIEKKFSHLVFVHALGSVKSALSLQDPKHIPRQSCSTLCSMQQSGIPIRSKSQFFLCFGFYKNHGILCF